VLSGILQQQAGQVSAAYPDFDFAAPREEDGWVLLTATRRVV
jgi:ribosomal protein L11 methylase PrmA